MLRTYFKLKIKKYAVRLVLLQLLLTIVMTYSLHHRLEKNKQLTADMRLVVDNSNEWYINRISEENDRLMEKMTMRIKDEGKGEQYLELAFELREATDESMKQIQKILDNEENHYSDQENISQSYKDNALKIMGKMPHGLNVGARQFINEILACYAPSNFTEFAAQYQLLQSTENHKTYLKKLKRDLYLTEEGLLEYIYDNNPYLFRNHTVYAPFIEADNLITEGDSLKVKLELMQYAIGDYYVVIEGDTIPISANGKADFAKKVTTIGTHEISGELFYKKWGGNFSVPFSHTYTVYEQ